MNALKAPALLWIAFLWSAARTPAGAESITVTEGVWTSSPEAGMKHRPSDILLKLWQPLVAGAFLHDNQTGSFSLREGLKLEDLPPLVKVDLAVARMTRREGGRPPREETGRRAVPCDSTAERLAREFHISLSCGEPQAPLRDSLAAQPKDSWGSSLDRELAESLYYSWFFVHNEYFGKRSEIFQRNYGGAGLGWQGMCHGAAMAALCETIPAGTVTFHGVPFSPQDISKLLALAYAEGVETEGMLAVRSPAGPPPAYLHEFLLDSLLRRKPVIIDDGDGSEVWNHAVDSFELRSIPRKDPNSGKPVEVSVEEKQARVFDVEATFQYSRSLRSRIRYEVYSDETGRLVGLGAWPHGAKPPSNAWRPKQCLAGASGSGIELIAQGRGQIRAMQDRIREMLRRKAAEGVLRAEEAEGLGARLSRQDYAYTRHFLRSEPRALRDPDLLELGEHTLRTITSSEEKDISREVGSLVKLILAQGTPARPDR